MRLPALAFGLLVLATLAVVGGHGPEERAGVAQPPGDEPAWFAAQQQLAMRVAQPPPRSVRDVDSLAQVLRSMWVLDAIAYRQHGTHVYSGVYPLLLRDAPLDAPEAAFRYLLVAYQVPALRAERPLLATPHPDRLPLLLTAIDVLRPVAYLGLPPAPLADARAALRDLLPLADAYARLPDLSPDLAAQLRARRLFLAALDRHWELVEAIHANRLESAAARLRRALRNAPTADRPFLTRLGQRLALHLTEAGRPERAVSILALLERAGRSAPSSRSL